MGRPRSNQRRRVGAGTTLSAMALLALAGCIDSADDDSTDTTLAPLVTTNFVTLPPATSTTVVADQPTTTTTPPAVITGGTVATVVTSAPTVPATTATTPTSTSRSTPAQGGGTYTVAANDTVYGIARKHGISADALATLNGWDDGTAHQIYPGDEVTVPAGGTATSGSGSSPTTTTVKSGTATSTTVSSNAATYVVKEGDYLSLIARNTGTTIDAIVAANGWSDGADHLLIPGQTIKLPSRSG